MKLFRDLSSIFKGKEAASANQMYPELLCIHIPKTAGRTFRQALKCHYGEDGVLTLDHQFLKKRNETLEDYPVRNYPVVHGHLFFDQLQPFATPASRWITWLRHPVERVLSNYFFYCTNGYVTRKKKDPHLQLMTLKEYVHLPKNRNVMTRFLGELQLRDCFFVGLQEHYSEDLGQLAKKLNWSLPVEHFQLRINVNSSKPNLHQAISKDSRQVIAALNTEDMALYEEATWLRSQGYWRPRFLT